MTSVRNNTIPRKDLGVKIVDDGLLILDKDNEKVHQLNETAGLVWSGIAKGRKVAEIGDDIAKKFDVSRDVAGRDVAEIIAQFAALGLLQTTAQE